jgi:uncharacterized SAM-binding protein YcdF (DUF218 family)
VFAAGLGIAAVLLPALAERRLPPPPAAPAGAHFDVIVVLGYPACPDGSPSAVLAERVDAAARWWRAGAAARLLVSGAAVRNRHVEAEVMAARARDQGVPADAIVLEPRARSTRENARFAAARMRAEGWRTALVVSSPSHLRRAAHWFRAEGVEAAFAPAEPSGALAVLREAAARVWEAQLVLRTPSEAAGRP